MADTKNGSQPQGQQSIGSQNFPSRSKTKSTAIRPATAKQWISPGAAQADSIEKKSIIARQIEDEIALDRYAKENTPPKKKTNHNLVIGISIAMILAFIFTLGGNLVDLATGGDGSHSWYGKNGVYNRFMAGNTDSNRVNSESDKNLAESLRNNQPVISNSAPSITKTHSEIRILNPPKSAVAIKPLPPQSYKADDFLSGDLKIHCHISEVVECTILDYAGDLGQKPGDTIAITLTPTGVQTPKDLGVETSLTGEYSLSPGVTATSGDYACTATAANTIDCWNLKTGRGMIVSQTNAEAYDTKYTTAQDDGKKSSPDN